MIDRDQAFERIRQAGLRLTPQRRAVIEELAGDRSHPLAENVASRVAARVPGVSLSTVYKILHELGGLGLVRELSLPGAMRFDPDVDPHAHLVCSECGSVYDIPVPVATTEDLFSAAERATGTDVIHMEVTLYGRCAQCSPRA
ncbi:MAG: transcriptional repressor [Clostridiales bacterium]|nr:transcriptional repressor [Clostridiales bacterium]